MQASRVIGSESHRATKMKTDTKKELGTFRTKSIACDDLVLFAAFSLRAEL